MVRTITDAVRAKLYAETESDVVFTLLTVTTSDATVLRFCNNPTESDGEAKYKTVSNGNDFSYLPFEARFPQDTTGGLPRAQLALSNVGREFIAIIRSIKISPTLMLQGVLASDPDTAIVTAANLKFDRVTYTAGEVLIDLVGIRLDQEPFPSSSFSPTITPGVFGT